MQYVIFFYILESHLIGQEQWDAPVHTCVGSAVRSASLILPLSRALCHTPATPSSPVTPSTTMLTRPAIIIVAYNLIY